MRLVRIYHPDIIQTDTQLILSSAAFHHVVKVLRLSLGAQLVIFDGSGNEYKANITTITKQQVSVMVQQAIKREVESPLKICLGQAISRSEKMDFTIQKAVELGVYQIDPLFTERCEVKMAIDRWQKRLQHWRSIAIAACEQSGRTRLPIINEPQYLVQWLTQQRQDLKLVCHPTAQQSLNSLKQGGASYKTISLLIGPEGGLSEAEIVAAEVHQFTLFRLGPRILRTETAALCALSVLQSHYGDLTMEQGGSSVF